MESNFKDAFSLLGQHGSESVFEIGALPEGSFEQGGNQYANTQGSRGTPDYGWGFNRPAYSWLTFMDDEDPREDASVIFLNEIIDGVVISGDISTPDTLYSDASNTVIVEIEAYNQKVYASSDGNLATWGHNRRIIRYADVLLMAAEALNENGNQTQALIYLNKVRERARESNLLILPDITTTNQSELRDAIYDERRRELFMEGLRFWDLIRTDRAEEILGPLGFIKNKHERFPIPQSEVDISEGVIEQSANW